MARRNGVCTACRKGPGAPPGAISAWSACAFSGERGAFFVARPPSHRLARRRLARRRRRTVTNVPPCGHKTHGRAAGTVRKRGGGSAGTGRYDARLGAGWHVAGSSGTAAQSTTTVPGRAATRARASGVDETDTSMPAYCARYALRRDGEAPEPGRGAAVGVPSPATTRNAGGAAAVDSGARSGRPALAPPHAALRGPNPGVGRHGRGAKRFDGGWNAWC